MSTAYCAPPSWKTIDGKREGWFSKTKQQKNTKSAHTMIKWRGEEENEDSKKKKKRNTRSENKAIDAWWSNEMTTRKIESWCLFNFHAYSNKGFGIRMPVILTVLFVHLFFFFWDWWLSSNVIYRRRSLRDASVHFIRQMVKTSAHWTLSLSCSIF